MDVYTREYVESFLNHEPQSQQEVAAKASVIARGFAYYGNLKRKFPTHYSSFSHMHERLKKSNLSTEFPRTVEGFMDFILYLGPIPTDMIKPTIGRYDHNLGYMRGNFRWQAMADNSTEASIRNKDRLSPMRKEYGRKCSPLTQEQVDEIRSAYKKGSRKVGQRALARKYNVDHMTIGRIVNNKRWV